MVSSRLVNFFFKYAPDLLIQFRVWYCLIRHPPENFFIICLEPPKTFCSQMRERGQLTGSVTRRNSLFLFLVPRLSEHHFFKGRKDHVLCLVVFVSRLEPIYWSIVQRSGVSLVFRWATQPNSRPTAQKRLY